MGYLNLGADFVGTGAGAVGTTGIPRGTTVGTTRSTPASSQAKYSLPSNPFNNTGKSYTNPVGTGTRSVTQAVKGDDPGIDWEAISGIVGSVAATTKGILDQQEARKQQREAARIQAASPSSSGGGSGLPIAGADLPWGKIAIGAGVGIVGILILKKLLS